MLRMTPVDARGLECGLLIGRGDFGETLPITQRDGFVLRQVADPAAGA